MQQVPSSSGAKIASGRWWPQLLVDCSKAVDDLEHKDAARIPTSRGEILPAKFLQECSNADLLFVGVVSSSGIAGHEACSMTLN